MAFYVTDTTAQLLAFCAKVATAMIIPIGAKFISVFSTRRAFQITYFSSLANLFSLLLDGRLWKHRKDIPKTRTRVSIKSFFFIILAILLWALITVGDLLVFQLPKRQDTFVFTPHVKLEMNFRDSAFALNDTTSAFAPAVLLNSTEANLKFGDNFFLPQEPLEYANNPVVRYPANPALGYIENIVPYPDTKITYQGRNLTCRSYFQVDNSSAEVGVPLSSVLCQTSPNFTIKASDWYNPTLSSNKPRSIVAFDTDDGARIDIKTIVKRGHQVFFAGTSLTQPMYFVRNLTDGFDRISVQVNGTSEDPNFDTWSYLGQFQEQGQTGVFTQLSLRQTSDSLGDFTTNQNEFIYLTTRVVGTNDTSGFASPNSIVVSYVQFNFKHILVPQGKIKDQYVNFDVVPRSLFMQTDLPDGHIVLSLLDHPQQPTLVTVVVKIDAVPAILLIGLGLAISLILFIARIMYEYFQKQKHSFEPRLELFHFALKDPALDSSRSLLRKIQDTDLVMADGFCPEIGHNQIGLVKRQITILPSQSHSPFH